jgi:ribosome-associated protein
MPSTSNSTASGKSTVGSAPKSGRGSRSKRDQNSAPELELLAPPDQPVAPSMPSLSGSELSLLIANAAERKKAEDVVVLDLRGISTFTEFYVICSGSSEPQLKAIVEEIQEVLRKEADVRARRVDGFPYSQWVVADFGDVIVHVFHESKRHQYALEDLWSDAPRLRLPEKVPPLSAVSP